MNRAAAGVARRHRHLELGLADASIVLLAARFHAPTPHVRRAGLPGGHPLDGGRFTLLPADA